MNITTKKVTHVGSGLCKDESGNYTGLVFPQYSVPDGTFYALVMDGKFVIDTVPV
jgi:hypothetical protein